MLLYDSIIIIHIMEKNWYNYIIFDKVKTYVGVTVDTNKRIRQHNGEIKGGAKYTRGGKWQYYCVFKNLTGNKNKCLSEEWHIKWMSTKVKKSRNTYDRRKQALENYIPKDPKKYEYVFFLSKQFIEYLPRFNSSIMIFIVEDFSMKNILHHLEMFERFISVRKLYSDEKY